MFLIFFDFPTNYLRCPNYTWRQHASMWSWIKFDTFSEITFLIFKSVSVRNLRIFTVPISIPNWMRSSITSFRFIFTSWPHCVDVIVHLVSVVLLFYSFSKFHYVINHVTMVCCSLLLIPQNNFSFYCRDDLLKLQSMFRTPLDQSTRDDQDLACRTSR